MKRFFLFSLILLISINTWAQDKIQPKWGLSYCSGRVIGHSAPRIQVPSISKYWTYTSLNVYRNFYIKNVTIQTGIEKQHTKTSYYLLGSYPDGLGSVGYNRFLLFTQLVYNFFPTKRMSPYLGLGGASRIKGFNTIFCEIGVNLQPKQTLPLLLGIKGRFARAFFSQEYGTFDYLDNLAFGFSVQYSFKSCKNEKKHE